MAKKRVKGHSAVKRVLRHIKHPKKPKISPKKHVQHVSYDYEGRRKRLEVYDLTKKEKEKFTRPIGIKVLTAYLGVVLFFYLAYIIFGLNSPMAVIFGQMVWGWQAAVFTVIISIFLIITIHSIAKRKRFGYHLSLAWFIFGIINSIVSLALLKSEIVTFTRNFLLLSAFAVFFINIIAIIYIVSEKQYFLAERFLLKSPRIIDKVFIALITIFVLSTLVVGGFLGYDFYKSNIMITDSLISELAGKTDAQQNTVCSSKPEQEKDLCLLIMSIKKGSYEKCGEIKSEFYRFACLRA